MRFRPANIRLTRRIWTPHASQKFWRDGGGSDCTRIFGPLMERTAPGHDGIHAGSQSSKIGPCGQTSHRLSPTSVSTDSPSIVLLRSSLVG
jgi:hypothetical protein